MEQAARVTSFWVQVLTSLPSWQEYVQDYCCYRCIPGEACSACLSVSLSLCLSLCVSLAHTRTHARVHTRLTLSISSFAKFSLRKW